MTIKNGRLLSEGLLGAGAVRQLLSLWAELPLWHLSGLDGTLPAWRPSRQMCAEHAAFSMCRLPANAGYRRLLLPALIPAASPLLLLL